MFAQNVNMDLGLSNERGLKVGDHIVKESSLSLSTHALVINEKTECCIYLDRKTGLITETTLTNFCSDYKSSNKSCGNKFFKDNDTKLYKYVYPSWMKCMSIEQTVANAKQFLIYGRFSYCCLTSSFDFVFSCKMNKYTSSINYPSIPTMPVKTSNALKNNTNNNINDAPKAVTNEQKNEKVKKRKSKSKSKSKCESNCNMDEMQNIDDDDEMKNNGEKLYDVDLGDAGTRNSIDIANDSDRDHEQNVAIESIGMSTQSSLQSFFTDFNTFKQKVNL